MIFFSGFVIVAIVLGVIQSIIYIYLRFRTEQLIDKTEKRVFVIIKIITE